MSNIHRRAFNIQLELTFSRKWAVILDDLKQNADRDARSDGKTYRYGAFRVKGQAIDSGQPYQV
jgi:hypothetical protein